MDCKELFTIFAKIGGKFVCNYKNNTGTLFPQNITCKNLDHAEMGLDNFISELSMYPSLFTETKLERNETVKKIHHYQDMSLKELSIQFCRNGKGYATPCAKEYRLLGELNRNIE